MSRLSSIVIITSLIALAATGCAGGGPAPINYYLIDARAETALPALPLAVAIVDLDVPPYLERFQIVSRRDNSQLQLSESHQWGEPLAKNLTRTLSRNLSRQLGTADVGTAIARTSSRPDVRLLVLIERFEQAEDGHAVVEARWQLSEGRDDPVITRLSTLRSNSPVPRGDYAGIVDALTTLFTELSIEIAGAIRETHREAGGS